MALLEAPHCFSVHSNVMFVQLSSLTFALGSLVLVYQIQYNAETYTLCCFLSVLSYIYVNSGFFYNMKLFTG